MSYSVRELSFTSLLLRYLLYSMLLIILTNGIRPPYCKEETADCTFQLGLPGLLKNACFIHQTNKCREMSPLPSSQKLQQLSSEDDAPFEVNITPYLLKNDRVHKYAVNISLGTKGNDITGFFFFLQQRGGYNSCRVFDFSEAKRIHPDQKIDLHYECYTGFQSVMDYYYNVSVRAVPLNQELKFLTYIPTADQVEYTEVCEWVPLVMVNTEGFSQRIVDFKFSAIESGYKVETYLVKLSSRENQIVKEIPLSLPEGKIMHRVVLEDVPGGEYSLVVVPSLKDVVCPEKVVLTFDLPSKPDS